MRALHKLPVAPGLGGRGGPQAPDRRFIRLPATQIFLKHDSTQETAEFLLEKHDPGRLPAPTMSPSTSAGLGKAPPSSPCHRAGTEGP